MIMVGLDQELYQHQSVSKVVNNIYVKTYTYINRSKCTTEIDDDL